MTQEQVETVSILYKEKSNIFSDLEKLTSSVYEFSVGYQNREFWSCYGATPLSSVSKDFREKIKKETIEHLQNRIKEIDKQLEEI